jgi:carbon-monoxide dehydrogenase small subunit
MLMTACALLERNPDPTGSEIREALSGVLCRCTGYLQIFEAVEAAGRILRGKRTAGEGKK